MAKRLGEQDGRRLLVWWWCEKKSEMDNFFYSGGTRRSERWADGEQKIEASTAREEMTTAGTAQIRRYGSMVTGWSG